MSASDGFGRRPRHAWSHRFEELAERSGPFQVSGVDPDTGEVHEATTTRAELASAFADARLYEDDDAA